MLGPITCYTPEMMSAFGYWRLCYCNFETSDTRIRNWRICKVAEAGLISIFVLVGGL